MKLLALRCPHCAQALAPGEADVVVGCPNCGSAVFLADAGLSLAEAQYVAPVHDPVEAWVPFWRFEGQVNIQQRQAQNQKLSVSGWVSARESQAFWSQTSHYFIPAWDLDLQQASELARNLLESQPAFRPMERPKAATIHPAVILPADARKLLELVVVTVEARRSDWLKELDFTMEMGSPALWILPAKENNGQWQLLAEHTRR